ncbi:cupin domain-containing protein [Jiella endophytica]|uniref:Cupin domain-containing protein n=1 Tax=Jiella endophytica TaxID=2558362 RepID=A0A4Y8RH29_9HYPH|nr:cupin domain-containing protein [Jiella endophytica]TFF21958.1 cupin domain-containing protein [Jiella endophytica]
MALENFVFEPDETMPNSPLPLIVLPGAVPAGEATPEAVQIRFEENGWQGTWLYTVFDYWHYHVEGHEVLGCVSGEATIGFGGDGGGKVAMTPGDVVVIPAGVGHRRLAGSSGFQVVGAYPPGQNGAITRAGSLPVAAAAERIAALCLPRTDPVSGQLPGALAVWGA